jgi:hypothetical protein
MARVPAQVSALLEGLSAQLPILLGKNLVGVYVYGSLTQKAFDPRRSDVDCIAVLRRDLSRAEAKALRTYLAKYSESNAWTRRLQLLILLKHELLKMDGLGWLYQFGRLSRSGSDGNPIIWMNVLNTGKVLFGPQPKTFIPRITRSMLNQALAREVGYLHEELVDKPRSKWRNMPCYRAFSVLTLCRILYTFNTGAVVSKPRAARWALRSVAAPYHAVIRKALQDKEPRHRIPLRQLRSLLQYAKVIIESEPNS